MRNRWNNQSELQKLLEKNIGFVGSADEVKKLLGYSESTYIWDIRPNHQGWIKWLPNHQYEITKGEQLAKQFVPIL